MGNQLDTEVEHEELAQTCGKEKADVKRARYLLAIVDEKGIPVRPATKDEAEAIARTLCQDISNNQLPCLKLRPDASSEPANAEPKPIGILSKHGGPCRHCGTTVVSFRRQAFSAAWFSHVTLSHTLISIPGKAACTKLRAF